MRYLPPFLLAVAAACFAFAYWGLATPAGRRAYDEIPWRLGLLESLPLVEEKPER